MKAIYLTGFMGAGKSTVGKQLAGRLGLPVIDTDEWIEKEKKKSISAIFAEEGEKAFRDYERHALESLPTDNIIITTGGGIVIQECNRNWMKKKGIVIYLHCEANEIYRRLQSDTTRPLLAKNKQENIKKILGERLSYYKEADIVIDTTGKEIENIVDEIMKMVKI